MEEPDVRNIEQVESTLLDNSCKVRDEISRVR